MMKSILFWFLATIILISAPAAEAQQATKIPRIGILMNTPASVQSTQVEAFRRSAARAWLCRRAKHFH